VSTILHALGRAKFVGQETGGGYEGTNAGVLAQLELPNSGLKVLIPLVLYRNAVPASVFTGGFIPDQIVFPTVEQLRLNIDGELEATIALIKADP
jgi:hypothetical protein